MQFSMKRFFTYIVFCCLPSVAFSAGGTQNDSSVDLSYRLVDRAGDRVVFELQVRNKTQVPLYEVVLSSDQVAVPVQHAVIPPGEVAVSTTEIHVDPATEPAPIVWTMGFSDASGRYFEELVE